VAFDPCRARHALPDLRDLAREIACTVLPHASRDFLFLSALGDMDDLLGEAQHRMPRGGGRFRVSVSACTGIVFPDSNDGGDTADYTDPDATRSFFDDRRAAFASIGPGEPAVTRRGRWVDLTPGQARSRISKRGRCSALVKVRGKKCAHA
jgi:hypothetical protein